jgi:DNA mismatch endonuclease, patch repair protein
MRNLIAFVCCPGVVQHISMDRLTPERRSWLMSRVKGRNTTPEMAVRSILHALGYRYRLHRKDLPGKPDIVFPSRHKIVFVHGCFWHGHLCTKGRLPKSNRAFWRNKIDANRLRDRKTVRRLRALGWKVFTVWQCKLKDPLAVQRRIVDFLE